MMSCSSPQTGEPAISTDKQTTLPVSVAIPTFGREEVLIDTITMLLAQEPAAAEILVLDQSQTHLPVTELKLAAWDVEKRIRWLRLDRPSQPAALNVALQRAREPLVLFLDDDIRIGPGFLSAHVARFTRPDIWAVAGQVLQPGEVPDEAFEHRPEQGPFADVGFPFRSARPALIENGMSGNLCVRRDRALEVGGFDENFVPPVAYRFDNEFCKRLCHAGGRIAFEPDARIHHLRAPRGGTRANGNHLTSMSPEHGVGDYYFALLHARGVARWKYIARRVVREVCTRFHLKHPWWIPVKLIGELRALLLALRFRKSGPRLSCQDPSLPCQE
ncbi:MAG: glycosyltransferase family 2 protein [Maioricimonas sp. JB049]